MASVVPDYSHRVDGVQGPVFKFGFRSRSVRSGVKSLIVFPEIHKTSRFSRLASGAASVI